VHNQTESKAVDLHSSNQPIVAKTLLGNFDKSFDTTAQFDDDCVSSELSLLDLTELLHELDELEICDADGVVTCLSAPKIARGKLREETAEKPEDNSYSSFEDDFSFSKSKQDRHLGVVCCWWRSSGDFESHALFITSDAKESKLDLHAVPDDVIL
jgi:hypothetical protein